MRRRWFRGGSGRLGPRRRAGPSRTDAKAPAGAPSWLLAFIVLLTALPIQGAAQTAAKTARVGYLSPSSAAADSVQSEAFRQGLRALGYVEGQNVLLEARYADGRLERLQELGAALVRRTVDVIVAGPTTAIRAVQQATRTIPVVMAFAGDPVGEGFAARLARPGGNITGHSAAVGDITAKRLQFLQAVVPGLSRVTQLTIPEAARAAVTEIETAGRALGVRVTTTFVKDTGEVERAFAAMRDARTGGIVVGLALRPYWSQILQLALRSKLPTVSGPREFVDAGGLMAYGPDYPDLYRRAATYVDKILRGARPGDLPVEEPTKFQLVINLKTAKALGVTIPPALLARADEVIE
jgi:putative ABC transport system substrate-binding protein